MVYASFTFAVIESIPTGGPVWKGGIIRIDGVQYDISPDTAPSIQLATGSHTIQVVIPSGYRFMQWTPNGSVVVADITADLVGFTTSGDAAMFAWITLYTISTAINISLLQTQPVAPGSSLTFKGKLTRTDTGAGISGQTVRLQDGLGIDIKTGVTDSAGNYSITVTAPTTPGTYQYRALFQTTSSFEGSMSGTLGVVVGVTVPSSATITIRGRATGGSPAPSMLLETYDKGVKVKSKTISVVSIGTFYVDSVVVTGAGIHKAQGRMVLTNPLGSYEFLTPTKEFTLG